MQNLRNETERLCELFHAFHGVKHVQLVEQVNQLDILKLQLMQAFLLPDKANENTQMNKEKDVN